MVIHTAIYSFKTFPTPTENILYLKKPKLYTIILQFQNTNSKIVKITDESEVIRKAILNNVLVLKLYHMVLLQLT